MFFYFTIIFGVLLDLVSKYLASLYLKENINLISDFLYLGYVENKGIAFSISIPFLKIVTIILILGIFYYYFTEEKKKNDKIMDFAFGLILAGAIGNGYERIVNSFVVDFIGVKYFSVFNLADAFICIGAVIFILKTFLQKNKKI
ncbi:signal peptidase II [Candidatus Gracilibacteria bacterium GN02-872]|nr:signal peptidase II [Candidatus Gracilibacteria bacterium GN02-872]